jgi:mercuric ion binding protein
MKILQFMFVALLALGFKASAQQKTTDKAVISTPTVQCDQCKDKIERALFKQYGILSYKVDIKKKTTTVSWITDRTNIENIKAIIASAGYDADDVAADPIAYKRLPACCKKPAEEPVKKS